jgi:hypothetical protein
MLRKACQANSNIGFGKSMIILKMVCPEAEFLDEIHTKPLKVFLLAIHSHRCSFALRLPFLQTHATSYSFCSVFPYTVKETGGKPDRKPHPFPMV